MNARTIKKKYLRSTTHGRYSMGKVTIRVPLSALPPKPPKPDMSQLGEEFSLGWRKEKDGIEVRTVLIENWTSFNPEKLGHVLRIINDGDPADPHYRYYTGYSYISEKNEWPRWPDLDFVEAPTDLLQKEIDWREWLKQNIWLTADSDNSIKELREIWWERYEVDMRGQYVYYTFYNSIKYAEHDKINSKSPRKRLFLVCQQIKKALKKLSVSGINVKLCK